MPRNSFGGEIVTTDLLTDPEKAKAFDVGAFLGRNSKEVREPEIFACARALKQDLGFQKVGAVGFCYGGWAVVRLAAKGTYRPNDKRNETKRNETKQGRDEDLNTK